MPLCLFYFIHCTYKGVGGRLGAPNFFLDISSSWVEISLHAEFQLPSMPGSGEDNNTNSVELEASLATAEAEVGAVAKADQLEVLRVDLNH